MRLENRLLLFVFASSFVISFSGAHEALADKIGASNLPRPAPGLKGRINDADGATSAAVLGGSLGFTSNAGPTLAEVPSAFHDRAFGYAHVFSTPLGRLDLGLNLSERRYVSFQDANERVASLAMSLSKDWAGQQTLLAFATSAGRDVEERLGETSVSLSHAWTSGRLRPYLKAETALLDYRDLPDPFQPSGNQDDRDRLSSRLQAGMRMTLTEHVELELGGGVDTKHYLTRTDDFGVRRGSVSLFPAIGLAYTGETGTLRGLYMPFWRDFRDDLFADGWHHGYAVEGEMKLSDTLKAFASARYGFEETDFLIASAAYESVAIAGVVWTVGKGTLSLAASQTRRSYDDLDLVALARFDEKFEVALSGEMPLVEDLSLNGRIGYLDYRSSFGDIRTDAFTAAIGLTYAVAQ